MSKCKSGKIRYKSERNAKRAKKRIHKTRPRILNHYHCPYCHGWHLTKRGQFNFK